ncbi:Predicted arabinose efflux permease, MFS family [Amycolatopsis lurida]|uniref:Transporter n=1 Tax=Amycolatopsis lurida NRRL 2430 TaxID=1460371 RepID=A0A2P2FK52_AMYLU|nr:MFS transporter [Amycolatopsis lurida]KFU77100.1 transporter [Amycolatopsis lurida NRRL 2430]SEC51814.1 Predicted arabinose efflux permease, MFS family [Amycolatopsis lurida]
MSLDSTLSADAARSSRLAERLLVPAGFITTAGNAFQITAAAILVFHAEQTTLAVGWLFIAVSIPQVALAVMFGKLVDKVDRRMLCVAADLVSAMTAFALPVWLWIGGPANLGSYIANFMLACTAALFMPASNGLIKERIRDERLGKFNSHFEMASNSGMLLASSLAGFLVIWFGATPLFVFNSLSFVLSAVLVYAIGRKPAKAPVVEEITATDPSAPVEVPVRQPIKRLALLYANGNIGLMVANVILTTLILQTFNQGAWMIGVVDALAGVGFIVGAAAYGKVSKRFKGIHLAVLGTLGNLICLAIQPLHYIALMAAIPFAGFCFAQGRIAARTLLMRASPEDRVGRIFGGTQAVGLGLGVGATVALSSLADATAVPYAFWGLAILQGAIVIGTYFSLAKPLSAQEKRPAEVLEATAA